MSSVPATFLILSLPLSLFDCFLFGTISLSLSLLPCCELDIRTCPFTSHSSKLEQVAVRGGDRRKRKRRKWKKKMKILRRSRVRECENRRETRRHKSDKDIENYFESSFSWGRSFCSFANHAKIVLQCHCQWEKQRLIHRRLFG